MIEEYPPGTRVYHHQWRDPHAYWGQGPIISIRVYVTPEMTDPQLLSLELTHAMRELLHHITQEHHDDGTDATQRGG